MESVTPDGGVRKRVTRTGKLDGSDADNAEPSAPVGPRAKVTIRYSLSLPGVPEPFDSSSSRRGGTLSFVLGKGKAIRGLEALAASMCVGEYCTAEIDAGWAYGPNGLERCGVPGNTTIECEMEMVDAVVEKKGKGILEMTALERFVEAGECKERGNEFFRESKVEKAAAEYQRCLRYIEYIFYRPRKEASETSNVTGSGDEEDSAEINGEDEQVVAEDESEPEGDTKEDSGSGEINGEDEQVVVEDESEPEGDTKEDSGEAPDEQAIEEVDLTGQNGDSNEDEQDGFIAAKTTADNDAENVDEEAAKSEDPGEDEVRELHIVTLNNFALCCIKMGENKKAVDSASLAASMDKSSHKPLFYRARARGALGDWEEAKSDLLAAAKLAPKNMGIRIELDKLNKKMRAHKANERKAAAAMFG